MTEWSGVFSTMLLVTCAMLSKEQGITVVGICLIYDLCVVNKVSFNDSVRFISTMDSIISLE